jgi:hypothetical protein
MKRALRLSLAALLALSALAAASAPSRQWSKVRAALSQGLPKTALVPVDSLITDAQRRRAWPDASGRSR